MPIPSVRRLQPTDIRRFGSGREYPPIPDLTKIQTVSYEAFLQSALAPEKRKDQGVEGVLKEIFPIESYDKQLSLDYIKYELGKPRYTPEECRQLRLTWSRCWTTSVRRASRSMRRASRMAANSAIRAWRSSCWALHMARSVCAWRASD